MALSPQKTCMIETLYPQGDKGCTSRELMIQVGCNNPADIVQHLRKDNNLNIKCKLIPTRNRYGKNVYIGLYSIPREERGKALRLLNRTAIPLSSTANRKAKQSPEDGIIACPDTEGDHHE